MWISNTKKLSLVVMLSSVLIAGCTQHPSKPIVIDTMQDSIEEGVRDDLSFLKKTHKSHVPRAVRKSLTDGTKGKPSIDDVLSRRFDVVADKMPIKVFFLGLVEGTPYNMVIDPGIDGVITINLKNVTIEEAMEALRDMYGYQYRRTSYGFEVMKPEMQSEIFTINYIDVKRSGKSVTKSVSGQVSDKVTSTNAGASGGSNSGSSSSPQQSTDSSVSSSSVDTTSETNFWKSIQTTLKDMVGTAENRSVVVNPDSGIIMVHAYYPEIKQVSRYLDRLQSSIERQVVIEAKVLEVVLNDSFQSGVDWSLFGNPNTNGATLAQTANAATATNITNYDSLFTITLKGTFRTLIQMLSTQGNVQVLSSPRISAVNNQKAIIKVGQDEFFVTGVSTSNNVASNGVGANSTTPTQDVTLTPFFSGVTLDVTPQISRDGTIVLHIHPSVSNVTEQQKTIQLGNSGVTSSANILQLPLALSTIRESDNIVRAKSGQVVVIGGLMANTQTEGTAGTPVLSRIPFFGTLFRRTTQTSQKTELVILLKPVLVSSQTISEGLMRADRNINNIRREFHQGGLSDIFGNEGEHNRG